MRKAAAPGTASSGTGRRTLISFAGRSAVLRRGRFEPALLRKAPRCSCLAVACGDPGVSDSDMGRRPLVRRRWRRGRGVFTARPGCLPGPHDRLGRHDSAGFDPGLPWCPVVPRESSDGLAKLPPAACLDVPAAGLCRRPGASRDSPLSAPSRSGHGASVPTRVHLPPRFRHTAYRATAAAPGRRHAQAVRSAPAPDSHRPSGLPVCRSGLRQCRHRAAPHAR